MRQKRWWELGCSLHQLPARHLVKHRLRTVVSRISHWRLGLRHEELDRSKIQVRSLSSKFQISAHHIGKMGGTIMTVWSWSPRKRKKLKFRKQLKHFKCSNTFWGLNENVLHRFRTLGPLLAALLPGGYETIEAWDLDGASWCHWGQPFSFIDLSHCLLCRILSCEGVRSQLPAPAAMTLPCHVRLLFWNLSQS